MLKSVIQKPWLAFAFIIVTHCSLALTDDKAENGRHRLSGALLFANMDGFRYSFPGLIDVIEDILDGKFGSIGEAIRKADKLFQASEIRGNVELKLPSAGEAITILDRENYDSFTFASPFYFSIEYTGPPVELVEIRCDLEEDDPQYNDIVCKGSSTYKVFKSPRNWSGQEQGLNFTNAFSNISRSDTELEILKAVLKFYTSFYGYHKLYNGDSAGKDMAEVIEKLVDLASDGFTVDDALEAINIISGVYLINLNVQRLSENSNRPFLRVDDSWSISASDAGGKSEMYGQLYVLPHATTVKLSEIFGVLGINVPEKLDMELPFITGLAFPLFSLKRFVSLNTGYAIASHVQNPISVYYNNQCQANGYVVFANLWERDGETPFDVDDCLAKGNAFGFDKLYWKSNENGKKTLSTCDYTQDNSVTLSPGERSVDNEEDLMLYKLTGTFEMYPGGDGAAGSNVEPYGYFFITIEGRSINPVYKIWKSVGKGTTDLYVHQHYIQPFMVQFREKKNFINSDENVIVLNGFVKEDDVSSDDDMVGNYDGERYSPHTLSSKDVYTFHGNGAKVKIWLHLQLAVLTESRPITDYVLLVYFDFWCLSDPGGNYEPYGSLYIDVGNKMANQNKKVWERSRENAPSISAGVHVTKLCKFDFKETDNFMNSDLGNRIYLHGNVMEADDSSSDDLIGDYDDSSYNVDSIKHIQTFKFNGADGAGVAISLHMLTLDDFLSKVTYKFSCKLTVYCPSDGWVQSEFEPKGSVSVQLGKNPANTIQIWQGNGLNGYPIGEIVLKNLESTFKESRDFMYPDENTEHKVTWWGEIWEDDNTGDDLIGRFYDKETAAYQLGEPKEYKYGGEDGNFVKIWMKLEQLPAESKAYEYDYEEKEEVTFATTQSSTGSEEL